MTLPVGSITGTLRLIGGAEFETGVIGAQKSMNLAAGAADKMAVSVNASDEAMARARSTTASASVSAAKFRAAQLSATAATERYNAVLMSGTASTARLASAEATMIRANTRVAESMAATAGAMASASKEASTFMARMRLTEAGSSKLAASMTTAGRKMSHAFTLPVAVGAAFAVDQATKFQKAVTLIQTAGGETEAKAKAISSGILQVAQETGTSLEDLSEGIYTVAKAGAQKWSATEQLEVLKAAAQGAKAEGVDPSTSVDALTSVMLSYGIAAKDAVKAENQIIRASGLSKTTMQEFAGSLANVVPIASSLGISFAQVAGAEATMTQHGETAQRAAENLGNLITNLAGQNSVASKAMQQLGINTVELQKDLAEKGLTGTLKTVEDHIAKSSKAGMVVVGAFKQARNATHDLQLELGAMSGALKSNSAAFAAGKMSYKDYYAFTKSLGGQQFAMAKDFITTTRASKGFNNQLKSGDADVRTTAKALQQMLGGVTGMRTALMLSGNSAKQFASNVQQVQKASLAAGADVLGWNKTQDTLAVKTDKAKASLQVLAVEVGDSLLPALSKLAQEGEQAIGWIDGLSHTQKEMLGWSLGVLAALGPVLAIGGRLATVGRGIGTFTATAAANLATLAGVSTETSVVIAAAMRATTAALAGAGVGLALGEVTRNSSDTTKAVGALGAALTGAAIGFGVGGPWGAAIGGAVGGLSDLAMGFFHSGDVAKSASAEQVAAAQRAKQAIAEQKQAVDSLTQAILADNDAVKANTRLGVEDDLQKSGAFKLAGQLGISTKTVTNAVLGHVKAQQQLSRIMARTFVDPNLSLTDRLVKQGALEKLNDLLGNEGVNLHQAAAAADAMAEANGKLNLAARSVAGQFTLYGSSLDTATQVGRQNVRFIDSHIAALVNQRHAGKLTTDGFDAQIVALSKQLTAYGYSAGQVDAFTRALQRVPRRVLTNVEKHGVTAAEIQAIINKYGGLPKSKQTDLSVKDHATPKLNDVEQLLEGLVGHTYMPRVDANTAPATHKLNVLQDLLDHVFGHMANPPAVSAPGTLIGASRHAAGGPITGPGTGTSDSVPAWLSTGEYVVNAAAAARNRGVLDAINAEHYAKGGPVGPTTTVSRLGSHGLAGSVLFQGGDMAAQELIAGLMSRKGDLYATTVGIAKSMARAFGHARSLVSDSVAAACDPGRPSGAAVGQGMTL